jgi:hypothetical protein
MRAGKISGISAASKEDSGIRRSEHHRRADASLEIDNLAQLRSAVSDDNKGFLPATGNYPPFYVDQTSLPSREAVEKQIPLCDLRQVLHKFVVVLVVVMTVTEEKSWIRRLVTL